MDSDFAKYAAWHQTFKQQKIVTYMVRLEKVGFVCVSDAAINQFRD